MNSELKATVSAHSPEALTAEDYARAARFLAKGSNFPLIRNATVEPQWIDGSHSFWYQRDTKTGHEFILVNPEQGRSIKAFDHSRLAQVLGDAVGETISADTLPLQDLSFELLSDNSVVQWRFSAFEKQWTCTAEYHLISGPLMPSVPQGSVASSDKSVQVFRRDFNLWLKNTASGEERQLTTDGEQFNEYGWYSGNSQYHITAGLLNEAPLVTFSPNGNYLLTERVDEREVGAITLWQGAPEDSDRPRVHEARLSYAGDQYRAQRTLVIIDRRNGKQHNIDQSLKQPGDIGSVTEKLESGQACWSDDSGTVYFLSTCCHFKTLRLSSFNLQTQKLSVVIEETTPSDTQVNFENSFSCIAFPAMKVLSNGDILWFSERSGWGHFYRYDSEGNLKNALTQGEWSAYEIIFVDEKRELAYVLGAWREQGIHPYYRQLYRVTLDGSSIERITAEPADHAEADQFHTFDKGRFFSPSGDYFIDTFSISATVPESILKTTQGKTILQLETADTRDLFPTGDWSNRPEVFEVMARDGKTTIYGELFKPSNFDASQQYPVIDHIYSSPYFICPSWPAFTSRFWGVRQAYAELGFIVVVIHGLGTCGRSKAFHEYSYNNLQDSGIADHVTAIQQLAAQHSYLDIDRVGIFGGSTGGYNVVLAMQDFPDFFKVGISSVPGVDHPHLTGDLVERWQGPPDKDRANYDILISANRVNDLKGKLLLVFGDMDENVPMHNVVRFLDAMTKHNKDYDLIYLPNVNHWVSSHPYFLRRSWDYFVQHLMGSHPPKEYAIDPDLFNNERDFNGI